MEWKVTTASIHDNKMISTMTDSVRNYKYIKIDSTYDSSKIYDYIFNNTHSIPLIDTNKRRGIINNNLSYNRKLGILIRKIEKARYVLNWEIERTFYIIEYTLKGKYILYIHNRNYDFSIGEIIVA